MDITQQQYMIVLAKCGSLTRASKLLGISQPALSNWLKNLEEHLGTQLVIRSKQGLVLTPAGNIYLDGAREMVNIRNQTYADILGSQKDEPEIIRITGTPNGGAQLFSNIFQHFKNVFPGVSLQFIENYNRQSLEMIRSGSCDLAFCSTLDLESDTFEYIHTSSRELILMIPSGFPMSYDASKLRYDDNFPIISLSAVKDMPFIMPTPDMSYYDGLVRLFQKEGCRPNVVFRSANVRFIYDMIRHGNGVGILPRRFFSPLDPVAPFSLEPKLISHSVIAYQKGREMTSAQKYVIDYFIKNMDLM